MTGAVAVCTLQRDGVGGANDPGIAAAAALDAACPAHADGSNLFLVADLA